MTENYLAELFENAKSRKQNFTNAWTEISMYFRPNRGDFNSKVHDGTFRDPRLTHPAPVVAVNKLASRITSDLTDVAINGFMLSPIDKRVGAIDESIKWAEDVSRLMRSVLYLPSTNFQSANAVFTGDLVTYGTAVMAIKETDKSPFITMRPVHLDTVHILEDNFGKVDVVFEEVTFSARQVMQEFKDTLPAKLKHEIEEGKHETICIYKIASDSETISKMSGTKLVQDYGIIYATDDMEIFETTGLDYFPYVVARFDLKTGEVYGRAPAWDGLPYAKRLTMLQVMHSRALQRLYDPVVLTTDDSILPKGRLVPGQRIDGGINELTNQRSIDYLTFPVDLNVGLQEEQWLTQRLEELFYVQGLPDNKNVRMTQVEVQARLAELKSMSPNIGRIVNEYLTPLVLTVYSILLRKKVLPAKPAEIKDVAHKFNFMGSLTNIYKYSEAESIQQLYQLLSVVGQFDPSVLGLIKHEKSLYALADIYNAPLDILKTEDELNTERAAQQQMAAQQQQAQLAQQYSEVAKNTTAANIPFGGQ